MPFLTVFFKFIMDHHAMLLGRTVEISDCCSNFNKEVKHQVKPDLYYIGRLTKQTIYVSWLHRPLLIMLYECNLLICAIFGMVF